MILKQRKHLGLQGNGNKMKEAPLPGHLLQFLLHVTDLTLIFFNIALSIPFFFQITANGFSHN